jgi:hypothetical protein
MIRKLRLVIVVLFGAFIVSASFAQSLKDAPSFVIDESKPYAYLKFDHVGKRKPLSRHEPDEGLWVRLINNCRLPIVLATFKPETDDPGVGADDDIVTFDLNPPPLPIFSKDKNSLASVQEPPERIPDGYYSGDVINTTTVAPGTSLLISFPANHVGPSWYFQIRFYLELPKRGYGLEPYSVLSFGLGDVPKEFREALHPSAK